MLGKLIKYEFKATGRMLLPLYGALIILSFINKLFLGDFFSNTDTILGALPRVIGMLVYIIIMVAIFIVTLFITIQRYRTNLLGDEGYLMNTIPVKGWQNITSKLIVAVIWSVASIIVAGISIIIIAYYKDIFKDIFIVFPELIREFSVISKEIGLITNPTLMGVILVISMIVSPINLILLIYCSLSLGSLFQKRKLLASFGAFILLNIVENTIATAIQSPFLMLSVTDSSSELGFGGTIMGMGVFDFSLILSLIITIIASIAFFIVSNYILTKKLNLD